MRKEYEIKKDLDVLIKKNHDEADSMNRKQAREVSDAINALRKEMSDLYSDGAKACPKCGTKPIGMDRAKVYEVGCPSCRPVLIDETFTDENGKEAKRKARMSYSSQGRTPSAAVDNWNNDIYLVDQKLDTFIQKV